jgi:hypothetical protein
MWSESSETTPSIQAKSLLMTSQTPPTSFSTWSISSSRIALLDRPASKPYSRSCPTAQNPAMAEQARAATGIEDLDVVADRGYFSGEEILACEQAGITTYVPKPLTSNSKADGRFGKQDFVYVAEKSEYRCPAGQSLIYRYTNLEAGLTTHAYWSSHCQQCSIKTQCTKLSFRRVRRWEHEDVIEAMQRRLDREPEKMRVRRQTAEHPFGTIKHWMGSTHFLTRTLARVSTEMSLHVLAYNLKRLISVLGIRPALAAMRA